MRRCAVLLPVVLLAHSASAQDITSPDGEWRATLDSNETGQITNLFNNGGTTDNLFEMLWYESVDMTASARIEGKYTPSSSTVNANDAQFTLLNGDVRLVVDVTMIDGPNGGARFALTWTNLATAGSVNLKPFAYADLDVNGSAGGDDASIDLPSQSNIQSDGGTDIYFGGVQTHKSFEISTFATLRTDLDAGRSQLTDTGGGGNADFTSAIAGDEVTLAAGDSTTYSFQIGGESLRAPTGACCLADGGCNEITADECDVAGGRYQGDGASCDARCPPLATCIWDQGEWDGVDGQSSEIDTAIDLSYTADDFCLKEGYVYEITSISACMLTDSDELDATLQLYHDCDGCPGEPVDCGLFGDPDVEMLTRNADGQGHDLVKFTWDTGPRPVTDEYGNEEDVPGLWLKGGCYWVSPVGIGDGSGYDRYFWATAGDQLVGAIPKTQADQFKLDGWEQVDGLNVTCRNFAFELNGEACCILHDNGGPADDLTDAVDTTGLDCYSADDYVVSRCSNASQICFFSAYIWTNCDCSRTKLEILWDDCGDIASMDFAGPRLLNAPIEADKCVDLHQTTVHNGQELNLYRVEWHNPPLWVNGSGNMWAAIEVQGTGSLGEQGYWAFADRCGTDCDISFAPGRAICPPGGITEWESVGRDHAFCVGVRETRDPITSEEPACAADYNGDGQATIADMLTFLQVWFNGCDE